MSERKATLPGPAQYVWFQCVNCRHNERQHLVIGETGLGLYKGCRVEGCSCARWLTPWPAKEPGLV